MANKYEQFKQDYMAGRIKGCRSYFQAHGHFLEAGYCYLMINELYKAKDMFKKASKSNNPRAEWALFLVQMLSGNIETYPTYFSIRNFLEIDLNFLIMYCNGDYIERILRYADYMSFYNPECYKFIGRVFWANGYIVQAKFFLQKAKERFFKDPELHYLLAYIYYTEDNDNVKCRNALDTCLNILPLYNPAVKLYDKLLQH